MKNKQSYRRSGERKRDRFGARSRDSSGSESSGPVSSGRHSSKSKDLS